MTSIHAATAEIQIAKKVQTDRQTDGQTAFQLYIVDWHLNTGAITKVSR